jgi:phage terminase large subunit
MDNDPISKLFITNSNPPKNSIVINMNYEDNPWFPQVLRDQMEEMKANDYEQYLHVWRGEPLTHSQAAIYKGKIISKPFTPDEDLWSPLYGADLGFARDPSVLVKCWVYEDRLYIEHEWYQIGVEQDLLPAYYDSIPGARDHTIYVDGGGLGIGSVSYLKRNGYPRVQAVPKWKGSVNDGIERMRAFNKIVIHPRCVHALEDFSKYSYKVDKVTGLVLPDPLHDHSDVCDSCRYAIFPLIKGVKLKGMTNTALPDRPEQKLDSMGNPVGRSYGVDKNAWMC